ncbi:Hint domain-containing protein [Falsihalocynthiibacter sp. S25ZX9]|uniref:Hint domain-containing protein n=1 Tax=Falsihalocynthiibacter sp. S25ZX9 TaxID=3240870 RepID=UPI00350F5910
MVAASELAIDTNASAIQMAEEIFGDGVTVVGASYSGDSRSSGIYTGGDATADGVTPSDTGVILSTGRASGITRSSGNANQSSNYTSSSDGENGNDDFDDLAGARTYDASYMNIDFIPTTDTLTMQFVFASDEFPEYSNSIYNDAIGVWINGDVAPTVIGDANATVNTVNQANNINLFTSNVSSEYNTEMDGFTVTLTLTMTVIPGEVNSIQIGIADVSDSQYDSSILIAGNSVQTVLIAHHDEVEMYVDGSRRVDVLANDYDSSGGVLTVTHINGHAVSAGDTITLATGQTVTLNADSTFSILVDSDPETINFTYGIQNSDGVTDTGYVTVSTIPCFVAGTGILTPHGEVAVETLLPGDLVVTHDNGAQPVRWIGRRVVPALGVMAPIHIRAKTFGDHEDLMVSPQHRVLVRDSLAELLFGDTEVLVSAKDLVNDHSVTRLEGGTVEYVHILFDTHEVVYSAGLATESFLPGPQMAQNFEREIIDEICAIFPEIDPNTGIGYSPSARRTLRGFEAQLLVNGKAAA